MIQISLQFSRYWISITLIHDWFIFFFELLFIYFGQFDFTNLNSKETIRNSKIVAGLDCVQFIQDYRIEETMSV